MRLLHHPHQHIARNVNELYEASATTGERIADDVAQFGGSWTFIIIFVLLLLLWMGLNSIPRLVPSIDPYPFIFLNLMLSCLAALQAPIIMMSQNRQASRDRIQATQDFQVNTKAELEVEELHHKLDLLREEQWAELVKLQQRQIALLEQIITARDAAPVSPDQPREDDGGQPANDAH